MILITITDVWIKSYIHYNVILCTNSCMASQLHFSNSGFLYNGRSLNLIPYLARSVTTDIHSTV